MLRTIVKRLLHWSRHLFPVTGPVFYAGMPVGLDRRMGDGLRKRWLAPDFLDEPGYENVLLAELKRHVRPGDRVVVVGLGYAVTAVAASKLSGAPVIGFEGSARMARRAAETAQRNQSAQLDIRVATVGAAISVYGNATPVLPATHLPDCDVLEMDCEGAELQIIRDMTIRPRVCIIETHGLYGAPTAEIMRSLGAIGYTVRDAGIAEDRFRAACESGDVRVVVGVLDGSLGVSA